MKKNLLSTLVLACLLGLCACGQGKTPEASLSYGVYASGVGSTISLKPDQQFEFWDNLYMSAYPRGTYEVRDGKMYATAEQVSPGSLYVFEIVDQETIRFCKEVSDEVDVEDGLVYRLENRE